MESYIRDNIVDNIITEAKKEVGNSKLLKMKTGKPESVFIEVCTTYRFKLKIIIITKSSLYQKFFVVKLNFFCLI